MSKAADRQRLDAAVVDRGLVETRARAQAVIMGGGITVDGVVVTKPGHAVAPSSTLELTSQPLPFVSRGGVKLRHALDAFGLLARDVVALDVGASTGGFTDVLLQAGARRVYAVDVGYGQLAWTLRNDARVVVMERTNIRHLRELPEFIDLAVIDVSFISLKHVLPAVKDLLRSDGRVVALVKPQFEAGRERVRKGVVRDPDTWRAVLRDVASFAASTGWHVWNLARSPIQGPAGNVEFLMYLSVTPAADLVDVQGLIDILTLLSTV